MQKSRISENPFQEKTIVKEVREGKMRAMMLVLLAATALGAHVELDESATMEQRLGIMERNFGGMQEKTEA